jgi:beta-aspartyl-peptidase (threonine type)
MLCFLGVADAAKAGYAVLMAGGRSVDAVEVAVISMEDNPIFNAG